MSFQLASTCATMAHRAADLGTRITHKNDQCSVEKRRAAQLAKDRATLRDRVRQDPELGDPFDQEANKFVRALMLIVWTLVAYFIGAGLEREGATQLFSSFSNRTVGTVCAWLFPAALIVAEYIIGRRLTIALQSFRHRRHGSTVEFWNALKWSVAAVAAVIIPLYLVLSPYWAAGFAPEYTLFLWFQVLLTLSVHSITIALGNGVSQTAKWLVIQWRDRRFAARIQAADDAYERHCTAATHMAQELVTLLRDGEKAGCHIDFPPLDEAAWLFLLLDCSCEFVRPWYHPASAGPMPLPAQISIGSPERVHAPDLAVVPEHRPRPGDNYPPHGAAPRPRPVPDHRPQPEAAKPEVIDAEVIGRSTVPPDFRPQREPVAANIETAAADRAESPPEYRPGAAA